MPPPVYVIAGSDSLALRVAAELAVTQATITVIWLSEARARYDVPPHVRVRVGHDDDMPTLFIDEAIGADAFIALTPDDQRNLRLGLHAREERPSVRLVLRLGNRGLADRLERALPNCAVLSFSSLSAATYAAAALDSRTLFGLDVPARDGRLFAFARIAIDAETASRSAASFQEQHHVRVVWSHGRLRAAHEHDGPIGDRIIAFGPIEDIRRCEKPQARAADAPAGQRTVKRAPLRIGPMPLRVVGATLAVFAVAAIYFHTALQLDWVSAVYFVSSTMTTTGYGDITPSGHGPLAEIAAMGVMFTGLVSTGILIAFATSWLTRMETVGMSGLRPIARRRHIVVCGAGRIGSLVIDRLCRLGYRVVVIERDPGPLILERARAGEIDLLTGDAVQDESLRLCNLAHALSLVAITNSETANIEIALGARAQAAQLDLVLRIDDPIFAELVADQLPLGATFSAANLAAPTFAGLCTFAGIRGRIQLDGIPYGIGELPVAHLIPADANLHEIWRDAEQRLILGPIDVVRSLTGGGGEAMNGR